MYVCAPLTACLPPHLPACSFPPKDNRADTLLDIITGKHTLDHEELEGRDMAAALYGEDTGNGGGGNGGGGGGGFGGGRGGGDGGFGGGGGGGFGHGGGGGRGGGGTAWRSPAARGSTSRGSAAARAAAGGNDDDEQAAARQGTHEVAGGWAAGPAVSGGLAQAAAGAAAGAGVAEPEPEPRRQRVASTAEYLAERWRLGGARWMRVARWQHAVQETIRRKRCVRATVCACDGGGCCSLSRCGLYGTSTSCGHPTQPTQACNSASHWRILASVSCN